jgi:beta-glucanase (GH16 family)
VRGARWTLLATLLLGGCKPPSEGAPFEDPHGPVTWQPGTWTLTWQDEFEGPAGTAPDPTKWAHELGGWGWGNGELQYYTDSTANAALDGEGHLLITARAEMVDKNAYTSARLRTKGLFSQAYGRFEARMKLVAGRGLWPAFWIMGDNFDEVGWPYAGELDIMEARGSAPDSIWASVHGPAPHKRDVYDTAGVAVPGGATDFHVYAVEWDPASIVFLVDDAPFFQITPARRPSDAQWVYDHPFFILLNLAVGGEFPRDPDATTPFPSSLTVDWVRVSARVAADGPTDGGDAAAAD